MKIRNYIFWKIFQKSRRLLQSQFEDNKEVEKMNNELLIINTHGPEVPEKLLMPFITANAALALDIPVTIFLMSSAVELVVKGKAETIDTLDQMPTLPTLLASIVELGGIIKLCGPCCNHRNIKEEDVIEIASIGGAAGLVDEIMNKKVVSF